MYLCNYIYRDLEVYSKVKGFECKFNLNGNTVVFIMKLLHINPQIS